MTPTPLQAPRGYLFFDLQGTLLETGAQLSAPRADALVVIAESAKGMALVTGQDADDPQVAALLELFGRFPWLPFTAYTTRGGARRTTDGKNLVPDRAYQEQTALPTKVRQHIHEVVAELLARQGLTTLIPTTELEGAAVRVNVDPDRRPAFAMALDEQLAAEGLQAVMEGHTSVFVMRRGIGKRHAVAYELHRLGDPEPGNAFYFGNEFYPGGNDYEVAGLPLTLCPLGPFRSLPPAAAVLAVGDGPDELYRLLATTERLDAN